ncbi:hypothetical protein ES708_17902 [subsurface metagenome]
MVNKRTLLKFLKMQDKKYHGHVLSLKMYVKMFLLAMELKEEGLESEDIKI